MDAILKIEKLRGEFPARPGEVDKWIADVKAKLPQEK